MEYSSLNADTKPVLKWAGGKSGLLSKLFKYFPRDFDRFIEPFVGGGAVFFSFSTTCPAIINDTNTELIELYEVIRDSPESLMEELDKLSRKYSEPFYYKLRKENFEDKVKRSARMVFLNKTGFNGLYRLNSKGEFNVPFGKRVKCPALYKKENFLAVSERLQNVEILNLDFEQVMRLAKEGDFIYCDPPYHPISPTSTFTSYTAMGFTKAEQARLKSASEEAVKRGAVVAVSNSSANAILNLYSDWAVKTLSARRAINSKGNLRGEINEVLAILEPASLDARQHLPRPNETQIPLSYLSG